MKSISQRAEDLSSPLLILFAFALPLTTSTGSITAMLVLLAWALSGNFKQKFMKIRQNPVAIIVLCYIALHIIGLLWSEDIAWGLRILKQQWKLLMLPIFLTIVRREHVNYYMAAFVSAIVLKASKAYLVWLGIISLPPGSTFTTVGTSHVIYNPMLALAIYIVLQNLLFSKNSTRALCFKSILLVYLSCNMFVTVGRTGQVAFFVLLIVALFQFFFNTSKRKLLIGLMLLPVFVFAIYQFSPTFRGRIHTAITEIQTSKSQEITSLGCRVWFYQNTFRLIQQNKFIGTGTGDFPIEYARINKFNSPN
jgi:O-antigen ligase